MLRTIAIGEISANMSAEQRKVLAAYLATNNLKVGTILSPGGYGFAVSESLAEDFFYQFTLTATVVYRGVFDPKNHSTKELEVRNSFLAKAKNEAVVSEGLHFFPHADCSDGSTMDLWHLSATISARRKYNNTYYYDIIEKSRALVGSGSFGSNYGIFGTVKPKHLFGKLFFSHGEAKRVVKFQLRPDPVTSHELKKLENESEMMRSLEYMRARDFKYYFEDAFASSISMRFFNGHTLSKILVDDLSGKAELLVTDRIALCIREMRELDRYFFRDGKVHGDVKPSNVIARSIEVGGFRYWTVKNIDLGHTVYSGKGEAGAGSPLYMAPELFVQGATFESEIYVVALLIALIWRNTTLEVECKQFASIHLQKFIEHRRVPAEVKFDMFAGVDLSQSIKDAIQDVLREMTQYIPSKRIPFYMAINKFENIRLEYYLSLIPPQKNREDCARAIKRNHRLATALLSYFDDAYLYRQNHNISLAVFLREIKKFIHQVDNDHLAVRIFLETLGVECLYHCRSSNDMLCLVGDIVLSFSDAYVRVGEAYIKLKNIFERMVGEREKYDQDLLSSVKNYLEYAEGFIKKIDNFKLDLDCMVEFTQRMMRRVDKIQDLCSDLINGTVEYERPDQSMKM
jgi:serine/threonine protein kinase